MVPQREFWWMENHIQVTKTIITIEAAITTKQHQQRQQQQNNINNSNNNNNIGTDRLVKILKSMREVLL